MNLKRQEEILKTDQLLNSSKFHFYNNTKNDQKVILAGAEWMLKFWVAGYRMREGRDREAAETKAQWEQDQGGC